VDGDADVAAVAALMGEPARASVLMALADGRGLAASTLAAEAGVAPSTVSGHLARLVDGGLITVEISGRHRYFRLPFAGHPCRGDPSARTCYDHLAGRLGVAVLDALVENRALRVETADTTNCDPVLGAGRAKRFVLTTGGRKTLVDLGVSVEPPKPRPLVRYCVDWSEQQPHLGGWLGAALLHRFVDLGWVVRADRRVVRITDEGVPA
jgi:DNA-binding transcriptional ArsR family regulator